MVFPHVVVSTLSGDLMEKTLDDSVLGNMHANVATLEPVTDTQPVGMVTVA